MGLKTTVRPRAVDAGYPGVLLTTANAARLARVAEGAIWEGIAKGELPARAGERQGREVWLVPLDALRRCFDGVDRRAPVEELADRARADAEHARLRERLARVEGELAMVDRVERAAQRYADRVEERAARLAVELQEERAKTLTLARALGQVEGERDRLRRALAEPPPEPRRGLLSRLLGGSSARRSRGR